MFLSALSIKFSRWVVRRTMMLFKVVTQRVLVLLVLHTLDTQHCTAQPINSHTHTVHIYVALEMFMKVCTVMLMVINGHHGVSLSSFYFNFSKILIFMCLAAVLRSKFAPNSKFSQSRWGY